MTLAENLDPVSGAYDAADGGHLYVLDNDPDAVVEINPADGSTMGSIDVSTFINLAGTNAGGLAVDPVSGNLWVGGSTDTRVAEFQRDGTLVGSVDLALQGLDNGVLTGLDFDASGNCSRSRPSAGNGCS